MKRAFQILAIAISLVIVVQPVPAGTTPAAREEPAKPARKETPEPGGKAKKAAKAKKGEAMPESPSGAEERKGMAGSAAGAGKKNGETEHYSVCSSKPWLCK